MHDQLSDGRTYTLFNVIADYHREWLITDAAFSLPTEQAIRALERLIEWRGKPEAIHCDNGPEYLSHKLRAKARKKASHCGIPNPPSPAECLSRAIPLNQPL
jgi:putative transposase